MRELPHPYGWGFLRVYSILQKQDKTCFSQINGVLPTVFCEKHKYVVTKDDSLLPAFIRRLLA